MIIIKYLNNLLRIRGREDIFETSINMHISMTWNYYEGKILLRAIREHDKTLKNP